MIDLRHIRTALVCLSLSWPLATAPAHAQAQTPPLLGDGVVIAMLLHVEKGHSTEDALKAMRDVGAYIRKQPGFIDGSLLASTFPGNKPSHVHISRWRAVADWEALSASAEFLKLLETRGKVFGWSAAEIFKPVK